MKFIGITGGVGAGKSEVLSYLRNKPKTKVMLADEIAHTLMEPGTDCYQKIVETFVGEDIFETSKSEASLPENRPFHRGKLAEVIFSNEEKRKQMNAIVHPAVKGYVENTYQEELKKGQIEYLVLEAALLIEEKYDEVCDELWYIYTSEENRRNRLKESRGYSDEKIDHIMASQLSEEAFRAATRRTIDNNGNLKETYRQIDEALEER